MGAKKYTLLLILLLAPFAYTNALVANSSDLNPDSVKQLLNSSSEEQKLDILLSSAQGLIHNHPHEAIEYAQTAIFLASEVNDLGGEAQAQLILAKALYIVGDYGTAIEHLEDVKDYYASRNDSIGLTEAHQLFGLIFTRIGDFKRALDHTQIAFLIAGELNLKNKVSELVRETGNIYFYFGETAIALDFYQKSLNASQEIRDKEGMAKAYNNMGRIYSELNNYNLALDCLKKALDLKSRDDDRASYANSLLNIGTVYFKKNDYNKALDFFQEANNDFSAVGNSEGISNSYYYMGLAYHEMGRFNQALAIQQEAWKVATETNSKRLQVLISAALSEIYSQIGDFRRAYSHIMIHNTLRDTVYSQEKAKLLVELETRYQLHAKQRQIELLSKDKELKDSEKMRSRIWIALLSILALLFIMLFYFTYSRFRFKSKANEKLLQEIQHRKRVEAQLNEYQDQLENLVEERTWELKVAKDKAEEADKLKTAFLTNMSHEIRTPMNAIVGFSYLLTDPESTEEAKNEYIKIIKSNGEVLMNLINDILDISMIESGQLKTKFKPVPIVELLAELKFFFEQEKEKYKKSHINIFTDYDEDSLGLVVSTDRVRLRQILSNLLSNAIKFTEEGSVTFGYRLSDEEEIIFFVRDTGIGIEQGKHQSIFDRFSKFGAVNESKLYSGTGLGLAICDELTRLLGGKIWLDSHPGKGSTFYFTLPFIADEHSEVSPKKTEVRFVKEKLEGKTILVAEDVLSNYQLVQAFLSKSDAKVLWAQNGLEAIDIFTKNRNIDIILMDIQMPIMDGLRALEKIREIDDKVPVIVNTAFYVTDEMEKSFAAGCTDYMTKPIRKEDLLNKLSIYFS